MHTPNNQPVFESASELTATSKDGTITLEAPGFLYQIKAGLYGDGMRLLRKEVPNTTEGGASVAAVVADATAYGERIVAMFSSSAEADELIDKIGSHARAEKSYPSQPGAWKRSLATFGETVVTAVFVCFLGAGVANVGWTAFQPFADRFDPSKKAVESEAAARGLAEYEREWDESMGDEIQRMSALLKLPTPAAGANCAVYGLPLDLRELELGVADIRNALNPLQTP